MDDAHEAIASAMAAQKQLAAKSMVRRDEIQPKFAQLQKDRAELEALTDPDATSLKADLDERIGVLEDELALAERRIAEARTEMAALQKLASDSTVNKARAIATSVLDGDPFLRSNEDRALASVREHIGELASQVDLNDELSGRTKAAKLTSEEKDAEARRMLEELKAKRKKGPS